MRDELAALAEADGRTVSNLIKTLLRDAIKQKRNGRPPAYKPSTELMAPAAADCRQYALKMEVGKHT
jgi:hypothetical protein